MKAVAILSVALFASSIAFADATVCNLKKVVKDDEGAETVTSCKVTIDPKNKKGNQGSGGINHDRPVGTLSTDCVQYPADYDLKKKKIKPFMVYDQGVQSADSTKGFFEMIRELGYLEHGDLGFEESQVASMNWYAGGFGAILSNFYVAFDENGNRLGMIFFGGMNPSMSFQGCYQN